MNHPLLEILAKHKHGAPVGVYSVCSANRYALQAAISQAQRDDSVVLIEATSNQVNQFGGYTGLTPDMFRDGAEVIIEGQLHEGVFVADNLMTKCASKYELDLENPEALPHEVY